MYQVIKFFTDLQDKNHPYSVGDTFPRAGLEVSEERFAELSTDANKRGEPLIRFAEEQVEEIPTEDPKTVETPEKAIEPKKRGRKKAE